MAARAPVSLLLAALCLLALGGGPPLAAVLAWDRSGILHGEAWRLWTGHLVHFSFSHAAADALALLAGGLLVEPMLGTRRLAVLLAAGAAAISLGLLAGVPALAEYRGASGLAMLVAALGAVLAWHQRPGMRRVAACAAVALLAKVAWEARDQASALAALPAGIMVAWQAHLFGILGGACAALAFCRARGGRH